MSSMWPELLDAMPLGMGKIMRLTGKLGFIGGILLSAMKPFSPVLFPRLLPRMMTKVMPAIIERVNDSIKMPDYMAEQMPLLMSKLMENLMPKMLADVMPLVILRMMDFLRGRDGEKVEA